MILKSFSDTPLWVTLLSCSGHPNHDRLKLIVMTAVITILSVFLFACLLFCSPSRLPLLSMDVCLQESGALTRL